MVLINRYTHRSIEQKRAPWNRPTQICSIDFGKEPMQFTKEGEPLQKMIQTQSDIHRQEIKPWIKHHIFYKNQLKMNHTLNVKKKYIKLLENENIGHSLF